MRDFTLASYLSIIDAGLAAGYRTFTVAQWYEQPTSAPETALVLRHDVDRRPQNALAMARDEATRGVSATYYFRIVPSAFDEDIVKTVADLGHEVGYHYEDFYLADYEPKRAIALFEEHLSRLRAIAPVSTIAMHGSPLARFNNMKLWEYEQFEKYDLRDCVLSYDWTSFVFLTDTGRTFGETKANLRDTIQANTAEGVSSSQDVVDYLRSRGHPRIQLSTHPERWNDALLPWIRQAAIDIAANGIKRVLALARSW
jgi:hypothetical protein